jgi:uncharacterized membrane protein
MTHTHAESAPTEPREPTRWQLFVAWAALLLPIGAWVTHLVAEAALTRSACDHERVTWVMHAITAVLGLLCVGCVIVGVRFARLQRAAGNGAFRFLGGLAAVTAFVNLLLIVWEGAYIPFLQKCHG